MIYFLKNYIDGGIKSKCNSPPTFSASGSLLSYPSSSSSVAIICTTGISAKIRGISLIPQGTNSRGNKLGERSKFAVFHAKLFGPRFPGCLSRKSEQLLLVERFIESRSRNCFRSAPGPRESDGP